MNQQATASQKTRAEQETENEANRLREQVDALWLSSQHVHLTRLSRCNRRRSHRAGRTRPLRCLAPTRATAQGPEFRNAPVTPLYELLVFDWRPLNGFDSHCKAPPEHLGRKNTSHELDNYGIKEPARVYWNLNTPELYEEIARRNEGASQTTASSSSTQVNTGRAAKDKAIVREPGSEDKVFWGDVNRIFRRTSSMH